MNFILGGVIVHLVSAADFTQSFRRVGGGRVRRRTQNGGVKTAEHWNKLSTSITGSGRIPSGLSGLDYNAQMELSSGSPESITSASNVIVIPANRRSDTDHDPYGFAVFSDHVIATPVSISGDTATLTPIANAQGYNIAYFPKITVVAEEPVESFNRSQGIFSWSIQAEES